MGKGDVLGWTPSVLVIRNEIIYPALCVFWYCGHGNLELIYIFDDHGNLGTDVLLLYYNELGVCVVLFRNSVTLINFFVFKSVYRRLKGSLSCQG